VGRVGFEPTT